MINFAIKKSVILIQSKKGCLNDFGFLYFAIQKHLWTWFHINLARFAPYAPLPIRAISGVYKKITISFFLRTAWCTSWITYPRWQPNLQGTRWTLKIWPFVLLQCSWWILVRVSPLHRTFQSLFKFSNTWLKSGPKTKSQCYRLL